MAQATLNPYPLIGKYYGGSSPLPDNGLTTIISALPVTPTVNDLVDEVFNFMLASFGPGGVLPWLSGTDAVIENEIKSAVYSSIDNFTKGAPAGNYNAKQYVFINLLTGRSFRNSFTVDTIKERILDIEDNISKAGLSVPEQTPILIATEIGKTAYDYFVTAIDTGLPAGWSTYFGGALSSPYANVPYWVAAAMRGALIGASPSYFIGGMLTPSTEGASNQMIQSLTAALTISIGKVIFKWIPRIKEVRMPTPGAQGGAPRPFTCAHQKTMR